jgi:serine/threonine protein kinase
VHRALTLRSIILATGTREAPVCIADWGAAADSLTAFSAPEGNEGDGRSDVYALGVIAYRALTGKFPTSRSVVEVPGASPGLAALITRMLATNPADRPTAAEVGALSSELLANGEGAIAVAVADAKRVATEPPDLARFADDLDQGDDVVHTPGPRFSKPKWTPAPPITITSEHSNNAAGEILVKPTKPRA